MQSLRHTRYIINKWYSRFSKYLIQRFVLFRFLEWFQKWYWINHVFVKYQEISKYKYKIYRSPGNSLDRTSVKIIIIIHKYRNEIVIYNFHLLSRFDSCFMRINRAKYPFRKTAIILVYQSVIVRLINHAVLSLLIASIILRDDNGYDTRSSSRQ